ncbi:HAD family hydrolase [Actinoplanes sp. NPDC049265]|uniref:HAD family hydrolase n=1 Tax=Actinoplanes sp. NPDC049265 TaxID=3363902 RepID=UPI0037170127
MGYAGGVADTAIFDVDGTLIDTNYHHAVAWFRAFRRFGITRPLWRIHRAIGMGGDQLVPAVAGQEAQDRHGEALEDAWREEFDRLIDEVQPFEGARELLAEVKDRGFKLVLASSGKKPHVEQYLDLIGGRELADAWTTSEDADHSKPEPDLVRNALARVDGATGVMVGDSTWDCVAAGKLDVPTIAVRTGGFSVEELTEAGAIRVFDSLVELRDHLDETPLARPATA